MRKLGVFNNVSLDGYFVDMKGDMSWAHNASDDAEWDAFVAGNASAGGVLLFGRITYDLMESFWPTEQAMKAYPVVAEGMNNMPKVVFSRSLEKPTWKNTKLVKGDITAEVRKMKKEPGMDMVIMGSGSIVSHFAQARLIDEYQFVVIPIVLGKGRTMFEGTKERPRLKLAKSQVFKNGNVVLTYEPTA